MVDFVEFIDDESENPSLPLRSAEGGPGKATKGTPRILVVGTGGAGGNVVATLKHMELQGAELAATNTDSQDLDACPVDRKILLGADICHGEGTGGIAEQGHLAVLESTEAVQALVQGTDMVFVVLGGGGGTGSGSAPELCHLARNAGALTVAVMTKPFQWEGKKRMRTAMEACEALRGTSDATVVLSNDKLQELCDEDATVEEGYQLTDRLLAETVKGLVHLAQAPDTGSRSINLDFRDVRTVLADRRDALIGIGVAKGPDRAEKALDLAVNSPLLEDATLDGATGVLCHIRYGREALTMKEKARIGAMISDVIDDDADYILGFCSDASMEDELSVMVVATGFDGGIAEKRVKTREDGVRVVPQRLQRRAVQRTVISEPSTPIVREKSPVAHTPTAVGRHTLKRAGVRPTVGVPEQPLSPGTPQQRSEVKLQQPGQTPAETAVARAPFSMPTKQVVQPELPGTAMGPGSADGSPSAAAQRVAEGRRSPKVIIGAAVFDEEPVSTPETQVEDPGPEIEDGEPAALYVENLTSILPTRDQVDDLYEREGAGPEASRAPFTTGVQNRLERNSTLRGAELTPNTGLAPVQLESPQQPALMSTDDDIDRPPFLK